MRKNITITILSFIFLCSLSNTNALTQTELKALTTAVQDMCLMPDRAGSHLKIQGEIQAGSPITLKIATAKLSGKITHEEWNGISIALDKYKTDPRACSQEILKTLLPAFTLQRNSPEKTSQLKLPDHRPNNKENKMITIVNGNSNIVQNTIKEDIDESTKEKINEIQRDTSTILERSERQPQITMAQFVKFTDKKTLWQAPNNIYPGSIIELHGFTCQLTIRTDKGFIAHVAGHGWEKTSEVVVFGHSGTSSKWDISSPTSCEGKVLVFSSPRVRSIGSSWREENSTTPKP